MRTGQLFALLALFLSPACGGGSSGAGGPQTGGGAARCGGYPITCTEVVERYLRDAEEAPLVSMDLDNECEAGRADSCLALAYFLVDGEEVSHDPNRASDLFEQACDGGDAGACLRLGQLLSPRNRSDFDAGRAARAFDRACEAGEMDACLGLGDLYRDGRGVERDRRRGLELHRRACEAGLYNACRRVADHYVGSGDRASLVSLYDRMCTEGRAQGCTMLADVFARGEDEAEHARIGELLERACAGEDAEGCARLGRALARGDWGVTPDAERAHAVLEPACRADHANACAELGRLFELGVGVAPNRTRADDLYEHACRDRSGLGCFRLGVAARDRPRPDHGRAIAMFRQACDSGEVPKACGSLAAAYELGRGVDRDPAQAVPLYHRSCDAGHADSCIRLAALLESGTGTEADPGRAMAYRIQACILRPIEDVCEPVRTPPESWVGLVTEATGRGAPRRQQRCAVELLGVVEPDWCRIRVRCGERSAYGGDEGGLARCDRSDEQIVATDRRTSPFDETPTLQMDTRAGTLRIADVDRRGTRTISLELRAGAEAPDEP